MAAPKEKSQSYIPGEQQFVNPYHFVALARALECKFDYRRQKQSGKFTGWLECTLETKTPIFIPNTSQIFKQKVGDGEMKCLDFFSYTNLSDEPADKRLEELATSEPVIPGSEIRGMIRSAFEAVTNSCLSTIDDEQMLYKRVQTPAKPGQLVFENDQWKIIDCNKYRLPQKWVVIENGAIQINRQSYREGQAVFVKINYKNFKVEEISAKSAPGLKPAFLHIGEYNENKKYEAVFVHKKDKNTQQLLERKLDQEFVPELLSNLIENVLQYRDKRNKTDGHHQYSHFDRNQALKSIAPLIAQFKQKKVTATEFTQRLRQHYPTVFAYLNGALIYYATRRGTRGQRYYLSPAAIGREVFYSKLTDLIGNFTSCTKITDLCETCVLFGIVGKDDAAASRVRFTDASVQVDEHGQRQCTFGDPVTLKELASPKLSATEFYLKQPPNADLWNYDYAVNWRTAKEGIANYQPEIRGRKFYWHHLVESLDPYLADEHNATERHVRIRPLQSGKFTFKVFFNNITQEELHKLLWVLEIGGRDTHAHKIGMGKPLGLGSVQIRVQRLMRRQIQQQENSIQYALTPLEKPVYAEIEPRLTRYAYIVQEFLTITDFAHAPKPVAYPCNEDAPETYVWFMANKVVAANATGTTPIIAQALPELINANNEPPLLKKYCVPDDDRARPLQPRRESKPMTTSNRTDAAPIPVRNQKKPVSNDEPFDMSRVRIETKVMTVNALLAIIQSHQLALKPMFSSKRLWSETDESLFIESLLLQIPLLPLHLSVADDNTWQVVDGLQRLKTLKRFVVDQQLGLQSLKDLTQFEGKTFAELPGAFQRKITDTQLTLRLIEKRTPQKLIFNIFYRLNMDR